MSSRPSFRAGLVASFIVAASWGAATRAAAGPLPHFQCYRTQADTEVGDIVTLTDQFGQIEARIEALERLCNPASTNDQDPGAVAFPEHLAEYTLHPVGGHIEPRYVSTTSQFGTFVLELRHHLPARALLVPLAISSTPPAPGQPAPGAISNFTCYHVHPVPKFYYELVTVEDELGIGRYNTRQVDELCVPVKKNGEAIVESDTPMLCFTLFRRGERPAPETVFATDEFGSSEGHLWTSSKQRLCIPTTVVELP